MGDIELLLFSLFFICLIYIGIYIGRNISLMSIWRIEPNYT